MACTLAISACSESPHTALSPTAASPSDGALNPDGSSLKVNPPTDLAPNGVTANSVRPTLTFTASAGLYTSFDFAYEVEVQNAAGNVVYSGLTAAASGTVSHTTEAPLPANAPMWFRARARSGDQFGPWSFYAEFRTPAGGGGGFAGAPIGTGGPVGPPRNIGFDEAFAILRNVYNAGRWDLGSGSSREARNLYLEIAVAILHYGHGIYNAAGPDSGWCIKNGGPGRPQADDVIARCDTRDAWDLVLSIGADHWSWDAHYIGRLPGEQAIYAPNPGTLGFAPQPR